MTEELKIQIQDFTKQYKNYKNYLSEVDWGTEYDIAEAYATEQGIIDNILKDLRNFLKENETSLHYKEVRKFFDLCASIANLHIERIDTYLKENDWGARYKGDRDSIISKMRNIEETEGVNKENKDFYNELKETLKVLEDDKRKEINFQKTLFSHKTATRVGVVSLNLDTKNTTKSPHLFFGDKKASLIMRNALYNQNTFLKEKTDSLNIKWESPNPSTSNEMFINMKEKDIPPYDEKKHFFEQPLSTIQFWEEEINKIKNGVNIGGYHISPFIYTSVNFGCLPQGKGENKRVKVAEFRDNEYFFDESLKEAVDKGYEALLMYGTRRFGKSGIEAQYLSQGLLSIERCIGNLTGFNTKDLGEVLTYLSTILLHLPPALRPNIDVFDTNKEIVLGMKKNQQEKIEMSKLSILNLDGGNKKASGQKPAGGTPDRVLMDEVAKGDSLTPYLAMRPALAGDDGKPRATVVMAGTAGESEISKSAEQMLKNTEAYGILPMNYDLLNRITDPEEITWENKKFATFVPSQMSLYIPKIDTNLKDFLKSDIEELSKISFKKTDWKKGKEFFKERRKEAEGDYTALSKEMSSHPLDTDDVYLSGDKNKFNAIGMKKHQQWLKEKEQTGRKFWFTQDADKKINLTLTNDPIIDIYPFKGGVFDAPVLVFEEVDEEPPFGLYVLGLDDVKHDRSDGDSVISATVYKRNWELSEWEDRVVCTYATRPERKEEAYKVIYYTMKYYNAIVFPENEDEGFKDFLERRYKTDSIKHLAESVNFSRSLDLDHNKNRPVGFSATIKNINRLNQRVLAYTQEPVNENDDLDGYMRINDTMLLEEMIRNKPGINADRIRSFGLALLYAEYLDKNNLYISRKRRYNRDEDNLSKPKPKMNKGFSNTIFKGMRKGR